MSTGPNLDAAGQATRIALVATVDRFAQEHGIEAKVPFTMVRHVPLYPVDVGLNKFTQSIVGFCASHPPWKLSFGWLIVWRAQEQEVSFIYQPMLCRLEGEDRAWFVDANEERWWARPGAHLVGYGVKPGGPTDGSKSYTYNLLYRLLSSWPAGAQPGQIVATPGAGPNEYLVGAGSLMTIRNPF